MLLFAVGFMTVVISFAQPWWISYQFETCVITVRSLCATAVSRGRIIGQETAEALLTPAPDSLCLWGAGSVWEQRQSHLRTKPAAEERLRQRRTPGETDKMNKTDKTMWVTGEVILIQNELRITFAKFLFSSFFSLRAKSGLVRFRNAASATLTNLLGPCPRAGLDCRMSCVFIRHGGFSPGATEDSRSACRHQPVSSAGSQPRRSQHCVESSKCNMQGRTGEMLGSDRVHINSLSV